MSRLREKEGLAVELKRFVALRTELADLAYDLERQGRLDAADVVMQIDSRVRGMTEEIATESDAPVLPTAP